MSERQYEGFQRGKKADEEMVDTVHRGIGTRKTRKRVERELDAYPYPRRRSFVVRMQLREV